MSKETFAIKTLREGLERIHEQKKHFVKQIKEMVIGRTVLVNNALYENCRAVVENYHCVDDKEYLHINMAGHYEILDMQDCELL